MKTKLRIAKRTVEGELRYGVHRAFYDEKGQEVAVSEEPVTFSATTPIKLRALIAHAFALPIVDMD